MKQISAIERLQSLPALFRGADLTIRFQWTSKTASQYLYLWKQRGLVEALGGHSDVFANKLVDRQPNWDKALLMAMPSAVIIGIEALRQAGWTTQVPNSPSVAVNTQGSVFKIDRYETIPKNKDWFATVQTGINAETVVPMLSPAWALADLLHDSDWGDYGLWPDDIEWSEVTDQDEDDWEKACKALGLQADELMSLAESSRSHGMKGR